MLYPSANKLNQFPSRYMLAILAAKRAKQLKEGAQPLVVADSNHPLTIALEEIAQGKVRPRITKKCICERPCETCMMFGYDGTEVEVDVEEVLMDAINFEPMADLIPTEAIASMSIEDSDEHLQISGTPSAPTIDMLLGAPTTEEQIDADDEQLKRDFLVTGGVELVGAPPHVQDADDFKTSIGDLALEKPKETVDIEEELDSDDVLATE